jgi:hypothetical protein
VSSFKTPLLLEYLDGATWRLIQGFRYDTDLLAAGAIYVPAGFVTDFASVPRFFWRLFPPTGKYGKAAVIHDFLYRGSGVPRELADAIFLEAMEALGVGWFTRHVIHRAVRLCGAGAYQEKAT